MQRFGWLFLAATAMACGSSGSGSSAPQPTYVDGVELMPGFDPGPAPSPDKGFQVVLPIVKDIKPGASDEYCTWTDVILKQDTWVTSTQSVQSETGHHVVMYYSLNHQTPGTHICTNAEMVDFRYGVADGSPSAGKVTTVSFPGDLAALIPAGAQIAINHHYLNASSQNVPEAQSAISIFYADPSKPHTRTNIMIVNDSTLTVPVGASTYDVDCTMDQKYTAWMEIPHAHNLANHVRVTDTPAAGGPPKVLFDEDWTGSMSFDPTIATKQDLSAPMVFEAGDKIHMECDYANDTGQAATFGTEMCLFVAFTVAPSNSAGSRMCDRGQWSNF